MTNLEQVKFKSLIEKDTLSYYDVKELLEVVLKTISEKGEKLYLFNSIPEEIEIRINDAITNLNKLSSKLLEIETKIIQQQDAAFNDMETAYTESYNKRKALFAKIQKDADMLAIKFPEVKLPYNWKEILDLSERLSQYTPEQQAHLITFLRSVNNKGL